jgi:hypothetical protein
MAAHSFVTRHSFLVISPAGVPMDERVRQRAGVSWALGDLEGLLARGVIDALTYDTLRRDYEQRLHALNDTFGVGPHAGEPTQGALPFTTPLLAAPAAGAHDIAARAVAADDISTPIGTAAAPAGATIPVAAERLPNDPAAVEPPPGRSGEVTGLWINLTLFLGAFFVVMASLIFVISSWRSLGAGAKAAIMLGFTAAFIGSGLLCLRLPRVRPAGQTFLGIGAILLPLDIVGAYNFFLREQGLSLAATWAFGAAVCAVFYGALALRRIGRVYAVAALLAAIASWWGALVAADLPRGWFGPAFLVLPLALLMVGRFCERSALGRATFGALPAWLAQGLIPLGLAATVVVGDIDRERVAPLVALSLGIVIYTLGALTQPQPTWRGLHIVGAGLLGAILLLALGWWAAIPVRGYAALALGGGWLALILGVALRRLGPAWHWGAMAAFAVGWVQIGALLLPWGYFVPDDAPLFWTAIFGAALLYAILALWGLRQPWLIYPVAFAGSLILYHLLRIGASPGVYGYAWAYTLAAAGPVTALQPLRRQGAHRVWDAQIIAVSQGLSLVAVAIAVVAGNPFQTATILLIAVLLGVAIVAVEHRITHLILPNFWGIAAVPALVALAGAGPRWAPSFYAGVGLALALALQGWRSVPTARRGTWFMAHRWLAGLWAAGGPMLGAWFLLGATGAFLASGELRELVLDSAYGPVGLAVNLCGAALAADAIMTLRRPTGYGASAVIATAILMGIARITPNNPQAYAVPLGIYLFALSIYVAYERDLGPIRMPAANGLLAGAVVVILGTTFAQSLIHPWRYIFLGLLEGLILLGLTVFLRRRYGVALCVLFLTLTTLRAVFDVARSLPNWAVIGLLGLLLLIAAVVILLRRDRLEAWWAGASSRWGRLG